MSSPTYSIIYETLNKSIENCDGVDLNLKWKMMNMGDQKAINYSKKRCLKVGCCGELKVSHLFKSR